MSVPDSMFGDAERVTTSARPGRASWGDDAPRTAEDNLVWRTMIGRIAEAPAASGWRPPVYRRALAQISKWADEAPTIEQINAWLEPTGWRAQFVEGYVPVDLYSRLQTRRIFPLSWRVRSLRDMDHSAAPDLVHDLAGHVPMLFDPCYSALVYEWAQRSFAAPPTPADRAAEKALRDLIAANVSDPVDDDEVDRRTERLLATHKVAVREFSRHFQYETFYTWAIEFGVMRGGGGEELMLTGAAALSSPGEMARVLSGEVSLEPFGRHALGRPVDYTRYQSVMYVAASWDDYFGTLRSI